MMKLLLSIIIYAPEITARTLRTEVRIVGPSGVVESADGPPSAQVSTYSDVARNNSGDSNETLSYNVVSHDAPARLDRNYSGSARRQIMEVLCSTIAGAAKGFDHLFSKVDVFVDVNPEHRYLDYLRSCGPVHIVMHANLSHPYNLAHVHRDRIRQQVEDREFDWFLYTEDDMVIP